MPVLPDPLEKLGDERGVLHEDAGLLHGAVQVPGDPIPGQVGRRDEAQALVVGLVENALLVEKCVGQLAAVARDAGEEHEVVVSAGDLERVELDRAEPLEDGEDPLPTLAAGTAAGRGSGEGRGTGAPLPA